MTDPDPKAVIDALGCRDGAGLRLWAALDEPQSAADLLDRLDVPRGSLYPALRALADAGLVVTDDTLREETSRRATVYRRAHRRLRLTVVDGDPRLETAARPDVWVHDAVLEHADE
jgi:DNA-binding transcriptional ArsR family regulator